MAFLVEILDTLNLDLGMVDASRLGLSLRAFTRAS